MRPCFAEMFSSQVARLGLHGVYPRNQAGEEAYGEHDNQRHGDRAVDPESPTAREKITPH